MNFIAALGREVLLTIIIMSQSIWIGSVLGIAFIVISSENMSLLLGMKGI